MNFHQFQVGAKEKAVRGICIITAALGLCALWGCASNGYQKGDEAAVSMQKAALEVQAESRALDHTVTAMRSLVNEPGGDLKGPFQHYGKCLDQLIASAERADNTRKTIAQKSAAYLEAWDRQLQTIEYQHIRDLSEARRTEVTNRVDLINRRYQESQAAVQPLIKYLEDIREALSTDLTPAGIESMKNVVQNANDNVAKLQTALDALTSELTNSSAHLSSVAYQASQTNAPSP